MTKIDVNREIRRAVDSGKVLFGTAQAEKSINVGNAKLLIVSSNASFETKEKILAKAKIAKTPWIEFSGTGVELGSVCGKPFTVSFMVVMDAGKSSILKAIEDQKKGHKA